LDIVHAIEHSHAAARASTDGNDQAWELHLRWATLLWQGEVREVIGQLEVQQQSLGLPPKDTEDDDPRKVIADTIRYFQNNASRMAYPNKTYPKGDVPHEPPDCRFIERRK